MLAVFLGCLGAAASFWRSSVTGPWATDAGYLFDSAWRIQQGEVPYRDFFLLVTPGTHYTLAALMTVFGDYFVVSRVYAAVQAGLVVWLTVRLSRRLGLSTAAQALIATIQIIWAPGVMIGMMWYDCDVTALALAAGCALAKALDDDSAPWFAVCGLLCGLACWYKQDIGAGVLFGGCIAGYMAHRNGSNGAWAFFTGAGLALLLPSLYLLSSGASGAFLERTVERGLAYKFGEHARSLGQHAGFVDRSVLGVLGLYALAPIIAWRRGNLAVALVAQLWFWALFAGLLTHHFQGYTTKMATFGAMLAILWALCDRCVPRLQVLALLIGAIGLRGIHYWGDMHTAGYRLTSQRLAGLRVEAGYLGIDAAVRHLEATPGSYTLIPHGVLAYFAAQRPSPTPMPDETQQEVTVADEAAVLRRLDRQRPRFYLDIGGAAPKLPGLRRYVERRFPVLHQNETSSMSSGVAAAD